MMPVPDPKGLDLELDDDDIKLIVEALRVAEASARRGIAEWVNKHMHLMGTDHFQQKTARAGKYFQHYAELRARFGDTTPVRYP